MPYPAAFRDATQVEVPTRVLTDLEPALSERFTVTIRREGQCCRIVGAPAEIRRVVRYLVERGIPVA